MLLQEWNRLKHLPLGPKLFSWMIRWVVPYTGKLGAQVEHLEPGHAVVSLRDRWGVRNHLRSVHAIALANLAEMASGMALVTGLPPSQRAILVEFQIQYLKKARGRLRAECQFSLPSWGTDQDVMVPVEVRNVSGEVVCQASAKWRVGPVRS